MRAVGLANVVSAHPTTPHDVDSVGHWLQVKGVHARRISAQVVDCQVVNDRTDVVEVRPSMSAHHLTLVIKTTVTILVATGCPLPTARGDGLPLLSEPYYRI